MKILAIETSCDETALALVEAKGGLKKPQFKVLKNIVSSQIAIHRPFGGVVPFLAKREHQKNLPEILLRMMNNESRIKNKKVPNSKFIIHNSDLIAVTVGPGLEPALWAGIEFAKNLSQETKIPLVGANHLEGHLYSNWLPFFKNHNSKFIIHDSKGAIRFPAVALVVSGGHTILLKMDSLTKWKKLGETRDDAAGEAFDKVAKMLNLPYPGGPEVEKLAKQGNAQAIKFPRPMLAEKNYEFSFSGLKTAVLYYVRGLNAKRYPLNPNDICAGFQQAVIDTLVGKTIRAAQEFKAKSVLLCGGVAANNALRETLKLKAESSKLAFHVPEISFNTDNAVMIAAAAYIRHLRKKKLRVSAQPNLNL
jgi:N6-L-threonylcarbamoyladenine synthase